MVSVTATVNQTYGATCIVLDFTSAGTTGFGSVSLYRQTPDGVQTAVRNTPLQLSGGVGVAWDDELPLNTSVVYLATAASVVTGTFSSAAVSVTGSGEIGWIKDPIQPTNDVALNFNTRVSSDCVGQTGVTFTSMDSEQFADADGEFEIINTAQPGVVSLARKTPTSTLYFATMSLADSASLETILGSGRVLLVQLPTTYGWAYQRYGNDYVHVTNVTRARLATQNLKHPHRIWNVPVRLVKSPTSLYTNLVGSNAVGVGHATFSAMKASGLTYAQLKATNMTYAQLAQGLGY